MAGGKAALLLAIFLKVIVVSEVQMIPCGNSILRLLDLFLIGN
jgi:hypothetical protein